MLPYSHTINVFVGFLGDNIISPFFLTENLLVNHYLTMLQDAINPMIIQNVENSVDFLEAEFPKKMSSYNRTTVPRIP